MPMMADQSRPILNQTYREYGDMHGFSFTFPATDGTHRLCVSALNVDETPGANAGLACKLITVRHDPEGAGRPARQHPRAGRRQRPGRRPGRHRPR